MTNIEIPRELAESLAHKNFITPSENQQLHVLLNPQPVTVQDYVHHGRKDEIKPGMWVEYNDDHKVSIFCGYDEDGDMQVYEPEYGCTEYDTRHMKPRFDLQPAFAPDGMPFPIVDVDPLPEPAKPETPEGGLFGRWATHPEHGRVLATLNKADPEGEVRAHWMGEDEVLGNYDYVPLSSLTFDPVTLTTEQEYSDAPDGTIVEGRGGSIFVKDGEAWEYGDDDYTSNNMCTVTRRVVRFGRG